MSCDCNAVICDHSRVAKEDQQQEQARPQEYTKIDQNRCPSTEKAYMTGEDLTRPARASEAARELREAEENLTSWSVAFDQVRTAHNEAVRRVGRARDAVFKIAMEKP